MPSQPDSALGKPRPWRRRTLAAALLLSATVLALMIRAPGVPAPIHQGQPLSYWAEQHPSNYYAAVRALGTNALPYLLSELHARDPLIAQLLQKLVSRIGSVGEIFTDSRRRRYYARLGLQVLDTNAVPPLLHELFVPQNFDENSIPFESASALFSIASTNAEAMKLNHLLPKLQSGNPAEQIRACESLSISLHVPPPTHVTTSVLALASDPTPQLRAAVMDYLAHVQNHETLALPALVNALADSEPNVRQSAGNALRLRGTNAAPLHPQILTLYSNTADPERRAQLRELLRTITPQTPLPH